MRRLAWPVGIVAFLAFAQALAMLLEPVPTASDVVGFSLLGLALLLALASAMLATRRAWWHWWIPGAWIGLATAALALAYKDTLLLELSVLGPFSLAWQMLIHALIAPIELFFGLIVGFVEPDAPLYILASLAVALLGTELLRRRLWPRQAGASSASDTAS